MLSFLLQIHREIDRFADMSAMLTSPLSPGSPARVNRKPSISEMSTDASVNGSGQNQEDVDGYEFDIYHFLGNDTLFDDCPLPTVDKLKINVALKDALYRAFYDSAILAPSLNMTIPAKLAHLLHQPPGQKIVNRVRSIEILLSTIRTSTSFESTNAAWNRHDDAIAIAVAESAKKKEREKSNEHETLNFEQCAEMLQFIHLASITFRKNEELPVMSGGEPAMWKHDYMWDWCSVTSAGDGKGGSGDGKGGSSDGKSSRASNDAGDTDGKSSEVDDDKDRSSKGNKKRKSGGSKGKGGTSGKAHKGADGTPSPSLTLSIPPTKPLQALPKCVRHCCDILSLRRQVHTAGGMSFVANGSILPRANGTSDGPLQKGGSGDQEGSTVVAFASPPSLEATFTLPCSGKTVTGMLVPRGITLITGGGYHGKTTLLKAIASGKYDHVQGDGREYIVTPVASDFVRSEDGRRVHQVDISPFVSNLPSSAGIDPGRFSTSNASGSTSQASSVIEVMAMDTALILMDEDTSAVNFMLRDGRMRALIDKETITPYIYRVNGLFKQLGISTIVVVGGSGDWLDVMDVTLRLDNFHCEDATRHARMISKAFSSGRVQYNGQGTVHQLPWGVGGHTATASDSDKDGTGEEGYDGTIVRTFSIASLSPHDQPVNISPDGQVLYYGHHTIDLTRVDTPGHMVGGSIALGIAVALCGVYRHFSSRDMDEGGVHELVEQYGAYLLDGGGASNGSGASKSVEDVDVIGDLAAAFRFKFEVDSTASTQSYRYLSSSRTLPFTLDVGINDRVREYVLPEVDLLMKVVNRMDIWVEKTS